MAVCEHFFADRTTLADALAGRIARRLARALADHDRAGLVVSGGSTPAALFQALARHELDWRNVTVSLVDERWVDEAHAMSNTALVKKHLLVERAAAAQFFALYRPGPVAGATAELNETLPAELASPTVAHIGLGADLHTASIFPGGSATPAALAEDGQALVHMYPTGTPLNPPHHRVTLTKSVLSRARLLVLLLHGQDKLESFQRARALPLEAAPAAPIVAFINDPRLRVEVYWSP